MALNTGMKNVSWSIEKFNVSSKEDKKDIIKTNVDKKHVMREDVIKAKTR